MNVDVYFFNSSLGMILIEAHGPSCKPSSLDSWFLGFFSDRIICLLSIYYSKSSEINAKDYVFDFLNNIAASTASFFASYSGS